MQSKGLHLSVVIRNVSRTLARTQVLPQARKLYVFMEVARLVPPFGIRWKSFSELGSGLSENRAATRRPTKRAEGPTVTSASSSWARAPEDIAYFGMLIC